MRPEVLCIIPARGGSKGLHKKNIRPLCGKPLIHYTILPALRSSLVTRVMVNTDDVEIADISRQLGAEVPFLRSETLAHDHASIENVLMDHLSWLRNQERYSPAIVLYMQPTDIFRTLGHIDECIESLVNDTTLDSCFVGAPTHKKFWKLSSALGSSYMRINTPIYESRQVASDITVREDTGIACATRSHIIEQGRRIGDNIKIVLNYDENSSIDIHTDDSFFIAESVVSRELTRENTRYCFR